MAKQNKGRKVFATTAAAAVAATAIVPTAALAAENDQQQFSDVSVDHPYFDRINTLVEAGVISGFEDGTFKPNAQVNRAEAANMVANMFGLDKENAPAADFEDVKQDAWYAGAINAVVEAGFMKGIGGDTFNPSGTMKRSEYVQLIFAAYGLEEAPEAELPFTDIKEGAWYEKPLKALYANGLIAGVDADSFAPDNNIKRGDFARLLLDTEKEVGNNLEEAELAVESVSAINAKTLEVTFNKELTVDEQNALEVEATRDGSSVLVEFDEFDGNKATVVRTNDADYAAGDYVLTITGLGEEALTGEVTVEEKTVTEAVIGNEYLLDETAKAKVGFELNDQYGEKVDFDNNDVTFSAFNKTQNKDVTISYNSTDKFYVNTTTPNEDAFKVGDIVNVSLVHDETGVSVTKELEVVAGSQLNSITLGDVELPEEKTLLTEDLEDVKVPYTAYDQYGEETELVKGDNVSVIVSDETVLDPAEITFVKNSDDETYINIDSFKKAGTTNVILLNKVTGETTVLALEVNEKAGVPYSVELAEGSVDIPAVSGTKVVDLVVTDKYGNKVEPKDYVGAAHTIAISNDDVVASAVINSTPSSDNYGKLVVTSAAGSEKGDTSRITLTLNATGESAVLDVTVAEEAAPFDLVVSEDSKHAASIVETGSTTVKFDVFDQYNNELGNTGAYSVQYKLSDADQSEFVSLSGQNTTLAGAEVTVNGLAAGSATLEAELTNGAGEVVDTVEVSFTVVANSSEEFSYEVKDVPTLYKAGDGDGTFDVAGYGANTYGEKLSVNAVAADGSLVSLPSSSIINVTTSSDDVLVDEASDGNWYVVGNNDTNSLTEDKVVTLTLNVKTDEGTKTITKDVTVSAENSKVTELKLMDDSVSNDFAGAEGVTNLTTATYEGVITFDVSEYIWSVDQFGVASDYSVSSTTAISATAFDGLKNTLDDTFTAGTDTITVADVTGDTVGATGSAYKLSVIDEATGTVLEIPVSVTAAKGVSDAYASIGEIANATIAPISVAWNTSDSQTQTDVLSAIKSAIDGELTDGTVVATFASAPTYTSAGEAPTDYVINLAITGTDGTTSTTTKTVNVEVTP